MNNIVEKFLKSTQPRERECAICNDKYVGHKDICEKTACFWGMKARIEYNRSLRPLDYVSQTRKVFLVEQIPDDDHDR